MLRPHHFFLLVSLLADGGTVTPPPVPVGMDGGTVTPPPAPAGLDAGTGTAAASPSGRDAGTAPRTLPMVDGRLPDDLKTLVTLDGRAVMAAHAAIQEWTAGMIKEDPRYAGTCEISPKAMDVSILQSRGVYVVQIRRRLDQCGWADPSFNSGFAPSIYVVSPEGRILAHPMFDYYQP